MSKGLYIGNNNISKKIKSLYMGRGTANKIKKMYIGDTNNKAKECYTSKPSFDPSKMSYTQDEFIEVINNGYASQLPLGCLITLNNIKCNTYEVIDVNHDGTTNTVDIMAHTQVGDEKFESTNVYSSSGIRTWINTNYFYSFDNIIVQLSKTMSVITTDSSGSSTTTSDKVKLLSGTEIGASDSKIAVNEGNKYPAFKTGSGTTGFTDVWRSEGQYGNSGGIWLRSCGSSTMLGSVWYVNSDGNVQKSHFSYPHGVLPVLRF